MKQIDKNALLDWEKHKEGYIDEPCRTGETSTRKGGCVKIGTSSFFLFCIEAFR